VNNKNISPERKSKLKKLEAALKIRFRDLNFLNLSFSHRSYANENPSSSENNERLEFLGDSVLGQIVAHYLYEILPLKPEGDLAKIKSFVVSETSLAQIAQNIGLDEFILIGRGEENSGGRLKPAILADTMEAVIGAYFLDQGHEKCKKFVLSLLAPEIQKVLDNKHEKDYKTQLQEWVQKKYKTYPKYLLIKKVGPDHDKTFFMEVEIQNKVLGRGQGKNKKSAQQMAAQEAWKEITKSDL